MTEQVPTKDQVSLDDLKRAIASVEHADLHADLAHHSDEQAQWRDDLLAVIAMLGQQLSRPAHEREPPHCSNCSCGLAPEPAVDRADAERWRTYLKCYDREEMVAAEWDGPTAIAAFIDSQRAIMYACLGQCGAQAPGPNAYCSSCFLAQRRAAQLIGAGQEEDFADVKTSQGACESL